MKMRGKLLLAQLPLVVALGVTIAVAGWATRALGRGSQDILKDNYRSVLAAQRMKESLERIDSGVMFAIAGHATEGRGQVAENVPRFEGELAAQEANLTEPGEPELTRGLREAWRQYRASLDAGGADRYFTELLPRFLAVKAAADRVLAMNQDAMIAKSNRAEHLADSAGTVLVVVSIAGLVLGMFASLTLTARVLRPLNVLGQTARRLGEGDAGVRARVESSDEIGALAGELNTMAERLQKYRDSSLGELLEAQEAAQAAIDSLSDPVLVVALDGELRQANRAAEAMLRVSTEAPAGALATLEPALRAAVERARAHVAAGRGAYVPAGLDEAVPLATPDGERRLLVRAAPLHAETGDLAATTVVMQDVTRQHRFEELSNDLVATVAHELRTPLTSLRMAVHLLSEEVVGPLTEKQADLVFAAREDCERLQATVDELLDLSRIQADRIELRLGEADPEAIVADALASQAAAAAARDVALHAEVLPGLPHVRVDRERIALVLANLVANAIKYGPPGGAVAVRAAALGDDRVRFEVADAGPGVAPEYQQTIFDKYVRVPGPSAAAAGGAGLGLYIAKQIAEAHGGAIGVDSAPAARPGATFWFTVPAAAHS